MAAMGSTAGKTKTKTKAAERAGAKKAQRKEQRFRAEAAAAQRLAQATTGDVRAALRVGAGFSLSDVDPSSTPAFVGDQIVAAQVQAGLVGRIADLQERLFAESQFGGNRSLLLVVQGMDTSGKGGIMRHVVGAMDPQAIHHTAFKAPTREEKEHPFLWRIGKALPQPGQIGVFDRSQYEDVLIVRVHNLVPRSVWSSRYAEINAFEADVAKAGTTIVKVMLHLGQDEQRARLMKRLTRPDKHWKFHPSDVDERALWDDYQDAYQVALQECSTDVAPWYVVPANHKWYARLAVTKLLLDALEGMDPQWPAVDYDIAEQQKRLAAT